MSEEASSSAADLGRAPVLLLVGRISVGGVPLAKVLRDANLAPVELEEEEDVGAFIESLPAPPDLLILPLRSLDDEGLKTLRESRRTERGRSISVLGVVSMGEVGLDLRLLRAHGVVGVLDLRQGPGIALDRIVRLLGPLCNRGSERARCLFPVGVRADDGTHRREFALNVSATGMLMTSRGALEVNTDVALRFRLPMISPQRIEANARVVHCSSYRNSWGRWELGLFFYPLEPADRETIEREVERLLTR